MLSPTALKRLKKEEEMLRESMRDEGRFFKAFPSKSKGAVNYQVWDVYFTLGKDSLYSGCILKAIMEFPDFYPLKPPGLRFISKMFHPNVYKDGRVCISILEEDIPDPTGYGRSEDKWAPVQNIRTVLLSILVIIDDTPNVESPANVDASVMFRDQIDEYRRVVRALAREEDRKLRATDERIAEVVELLKEEPERCL
jgi:ubiquitin-conjugating enzyme E2 G2